MMLKNIGLYCWEKNWSAEMDASEPENSGRHGRLLYFRLRLCGPTSCGWFCGAILPYTILGLARCDLFLGSILQSER